MIGVGETDDEVSDAMRQLRAANVEMLTLGQYIAPGPPDERYLPVDRYVPPDQFSRWADEARTLGFRAVAAGPLVRSSYRAGLLLSEARRL
jgi:lipoic acid synthetase